MIDRNILQELHGLFVLINRSAHLLSKFNVLPTKQDLDINDGLTKAKRFWIEVNEEEVSGKDIFKDILKLGDVTGVNYKILVNESDKSISRYFYFVTKDVHTSLDVLMAFQNVKSPGYEVKSVGITPK